MSPGNFPPADESREPPPGDLTEDALAQDLEALAAGELAPEDAHTLKARLATEPRLAALYDEARRVERLLREEPLLPLPLQLVGRILESTAPPRARPVVQLARVAAVVLIFFASWVAFAGDVPAMADVAAHPRLVASLESTPLPEALPPLSEVVFRATEPDSTEPSTVGIVMSTVIGLLLLLVGVAFGLFSHLAAATPTAPPNRDSRKVLP